MASTKKDSNSRLVPILRDGVAVVLMVFFKQCKVLIVKKYPNRDATAHTMLAAAITNEVFGSHNTDEKFQTFRKNNQEIINLELTTIQSDIPELLAPLTDALRIQMLCDKQEDIDSSWLLKQADMNKILLHERDAPLPSVFMEMVRTLGAEHKLTVPPVKINSTDEQHLLH